MPVEVNMPPDMTQVGSDVQRHLKSHGAGMEVVQVLVPVPKRLLRPGAGMEDLADEVYEQVREAIQVTIQRRRAEQFYGKGGR